jgi:hypothetical protein
MNSRDHCSRDDFDILIRQALIDSVEDAEPPAHVWERIRAGLAQPEHRPTTIRWTTPILQAVMLLVLMLGSTVIWQDQLFGPDRAAVPDSLPTAAVASPSYSGPALSRSAHIPSLILYDPDVPRMSVRGMNDIMDPVETAVLRKHSSTQLRTFAVEEHPQLESSVAATSESLLPDDFTDFQVKIMLLQSLQDSQPAQRERKSSEQSLFRPALSWQ